MPSAYAHLRFWLGEVLVRHPYATGPQPKI